MGSIVNNAPAWQFWLNLLQFIVTCAVWLYVWNSNRTRVTNKKIESLQADHEDRFDDHSNRLTHLESEMSHVITTADLKEIFRRMNAMDRSLSEMRGEFTGVKNLLNNIDAFLRHKEQ